MAEYSKREIAERLGRPVRTITYWTDFSLVVPDVKPSRGKGRARIFSDKNLIEFAMIDIMVKNLDINLDTVQFIFKNLREGYDLGTGGLAIDSNWFPQKRVASFKDFFTNRDWGRKKELLYVEMHFVFAPTNKIVGPAKVFNIIDGTTDLSGIFGFKAQIKADMLCERTIRLGQIRNFATKNLILGEQLKIDKNT